MCSELVSDINARRRRVEKALASADRDGLRSMIDHLLEADEKNMKLIDMLIAEPSPENDRRAFMKALLSLEDRYGGYGGFIEYPDDEDFIFDLRDLLRSRLSCLVRKNEFDTALDIVSDVWVRADGYEIDGSYGEYGELFDAVLDAFEFLRTKADAATCDAVRRRIEDLIEKGEPDNWCQIDDLEKYLKKAFSKDGDE